MSDASAESAMSGSFNEGLKRKLKSAALSAQGLAFKLLVWLLALAGVVLILWSELNHETGPNHEETATFYVVVRDLGIGLLVSAFVTSLIEWHASKTLRLEVATDVVEAVFQRLIPDSIWRQVATHVFRAETVSYELELNIEVLGRDNQEAKAFEESYKNEQGVHLMRYTARRRVVNVNQTKDVPYKLHAGVDADLSMPELNIPRFDKIIVTGRESASDIALQFKDGTGDRTPAGGEFKTAPPSIFYDLWTKAGDDHTAIVDDVTFKCVPDVGVSFEVTCKIPAAGEMKVSYDTWRGIRSPGIFPYTIGVPADGMVVNVIAPPQMKITVTPLHADPKAVSQVSEREWRLDRGILPGQGVQVNFSPREAAQAAQGAAPPAAGAISSPGPAASPAPDGS